ncbi:hypothetical protein Tco_0278377 [Tanacetum coccineum]
MVAVEVPQTLKYKGGQLNADPVLEDFQDSSDDEEGIRSSKECINDLEEEYQARALLAKSKRFLKKDTQRFSSAKAMTKLNATNVARRVILQETVDFEAKYNKVKGLIAETYDWDEEEVSSDDNEVIKVKALMALVDEERVFVGKESAKNGEWIKISMKKLLVLKQEKLDLLTMQHVNTEILKENQNLRNKLKELSSITEAKLNNNVSITDSNKPRLSEAKISTLSNHDTGKIPSVESQRNTTDPSVAVTESLATNYDSADESSVYSTPLPPLNKLDGAKPISRPKTIKSILKSKFTFKAESLKGIILNEPSSSEAKKFFRC